MSIGQAMRPVALSDEIAVGEIPSAQQYAILAKAGFRSVLNVQPDGEVSRLGDAASAKTAAEAAGLSYASTPIESRLPSEAHINRFAEALAALPRPVYACCYSGGRAAAAWALAMAPRNKPVAIVQSLEAAGYDASALKTALDRRHRGLEAFETSPVSPLVPRATANGAGDQTGNEAPTSGAASADAKSAEATIILPRAASAGGFAVSG